MRIATVYRNELSNTTRLDSSFYLSDGKIASQKVKMAISSGANCFSLGDSAIVRIWKPSSSIAYAVEGEPFAPYLQPYDILEYLPEARAKVSIARSDIESLRIREGTILQTCSGRNLGPLVIADKYLESFVLGSDLIRIDICDINIRYYIYAFLNTWMGQALLHSNKTGSVIDHLNVQDIAAIQVPYWNDDRINEVALLIKESFNYFSRARSELSACKEAFFNEIQTEIKHERLSLGWTISFSDIAESMRADAAYHDPMTKKASKELTQNGGIPLCTVADVVKPSGRYKTNYVEKEYGFPIMSGRQLLQEQIVGLKYLPKASAKSYRNFFLKKNWIAYPADGRVEGRLGTPVMITNSRENWCASGHVGRIKPHEGINPGYLYLAMSHPAVQAQISALACGSVVDAVYPEDVEKIVIPNMIPFSYHRVVNAWDDFDRANTFKEKASNLIISYFENDA